MLDMSWGEVMVIGAVALIVIGPKDLPRVMRTVGYWVGRARGMARHFRSGIDSMIREAELEEMEKKWKAENERIMREYPALPPVDGVEPLAAAPSTEGEAEADGATVSPPDERRELP